MDIHKKADSFFEMFEYLTDGEEHQLKIIKRAITGQTTFLVDGQYAFNLPSEKVADLLEVVKERAEIE